MGVLQYWNIACPSSQVPEEYRMAYILSKLAPFEQVRYGMFHPDNKFWEPPQFIWRYPQKFAHLLEDIRECIETFQGRAQWVYIKGSLNSSIEVINPLFTGIYTFDYVPEHMRQAYQQWITVCISDIPLLCTYIEAKLHLEEVKPQRSVKRH